MAHDLANAEDHRVLREVPEEARRSHDPSVRRRAARAVARILDADDTPLLHAIEDDDDEVAAWAAYGLGESCKGAEDRHGRALATRLASLDPASPLRAWMRGSPFSERSGAVAVKALRKRYDGGFVAGRTSRRRHMRLGMLRLTGPSCRSTLRRRFSMPRAISAARHFTLYAFGRMEGAPEKEVRARLIAAAQASLDRPGPTRIFAVRALGHAATPDAVAPLARVLASGAFTPPERAEAAHALGRLRKAGQAALVDALVALVPERMAEATSGDDYGVWLAVVGALGSDPPKSAETALWAMARREPSSPSPPVVRRTSVIRCAAAVHLARVAWDADVLRGCDVGDGEAGENARPECSRASNRSRSRVGPLGVT